MLCMVQKVNMMLLEDVCFLLMHSICIIRSFIDALFDRVDLIKFCFLWDNIIFPSFRNVKGICDAVLKFMNKKYNRSGRLQMKKWEVTRT